MPIRNARKYDHFPHRLQKHHCVCISSFYKVSWLIGIWVNKWSTYWDTINRYSNNTNTLKHSLERMEQSDRSWLLWTPLKSSEEDGKKYNAQLYHEAKTETTLYFPDLVNGTIKIKICWERSNLLSSIMSVFLYNLELQIQNAKWGQP